MPTIPAPHSRAQTDGTFTLDRISPKVTCLTLTENIVMFWEGYPVAVLTGSIVYHHTDTPSSALTKALGVFSEDGAEHRPMVRSSAQSFDFLLGQILTQAGLPLTRRPEQDTQ